VLGQKLLEAVFGDQAVRRLADHARTDLEARVTVLYADEAARYHRAIDGLELRAEHTQALWDAAREVGATRLAR
jgi:hypothetical protein